MEDKESFLKRWSRLKQDAAKPEINQTKAKPVAKAQDLPKPDLTPIEKLDIDADFSGYMHSKIEESLRRTALKKLFQDPHFRFENMDKLDTYIDNYSLPDPIPPDMLAQLMKSSPQLFPSNEDGSSSKVDAGKKPIQSRDEGEKILESKSGETTEPPVQAPRTEAEQADKPGQIVKDKS